MTFVPARVVLRIVAATTLASAFAVTLSARQYQGWYIPEGGRDEKSPMALVSGAAEKGKTLYATHCAKCHGPLGKGDGPASDYAADLTDDLRIELNSEGVLFYKIWNGRIKYGKGPTEDMPAFQGKLERDQVWALVEYLKILRVPRRIH